MQELVCRELCVQTGTATAIAANRGSQRHDGNQNHDDCRLTEQRNNNSNDGDGDDGDGDARVRRSARRAEGRYL